MIDLQGHLANHQRPIFEQQVIGLEDAAGLRVFNRNQREIDRLVRDPMEDMAQRPKGLGRRCRKTCVQSLLGIGARFPLVADRDLARDSQTLSSR